MFDCAANWPRCVSQQGPTAAKNSKFAHLVALAKDRSISRWRSDLAQPNLDRNFGGRVGITCRSPRHVLAAVDEQAGELRPSHRCGHGGARLAEAESEAAGLLQLGQKPLGRDLGSFRLRCLKLAHAQLYLIES
jgi:hypothetical protein